MSWVEGLFSFNEKTTKDEMMMEIYESFETERGYMEPVFQELVLSDKVFDCIEEADKYLSTSSTAAKYYRRKDFGVKYKCYSSAAPSKKYLEIEKRIEETKMKLNAYKEKHSISNFKSEFIGCPECKSKLKRVLLKSHKCPVCRSDMRSETTKKTLHNYQTKLEALNKSLIEEKRKQSKKIELKWRVSAQAYLG